MCRSHHDHHGRRDPHQRERHPERHRDDPERHLYRRRRHRDHGWDHRGPHRRAHASTDRHRGCRRPAWASCRGSGEACRPDEDRSSRPDGACASRWRPRGPRDELYRRPRQDAGRGDVRPCPERARTGCCRAAVRQDGGSRCSATEPQPDAERPDGEPRTRVLDAVRRTVRTDEGSGLPRRGVTWTVPQARPSARPAQAPRLPEPARGPRQLPAWAVRRAPRVSQVRWMSTVRWEQRLLRSPGRREPGGSRGQRGWEQRSPAAQGHRRAPTSRGPCAPRGPRVLTRRTGRTRPCRSVW